MRKDLNEELKKYLSIDEIKALENANGRSDKENLLFEKITSPKWFYPLKLLGYFELSKIPSPIEKNGSYSLCYWNILPYLEKLSKQPLSDDLLFEILSIIMKVTDHHKNNDSCIGKSDIKLTDCFGAWWSFSKILSNLPSTKIPKEILELVEVWSKSKFYDFIIANEIAEKLIPNFLNENSSIDDIEKFEIIFDKFTLLYKEEMKGEFTNFFGKRRYHFYTHMYTLNMLIQEINFINLIGRKCSRRFFENLIFKIRIILSYPENFPKFKSGNDTIELRFDNTKNNLGLNVVKIYKISPEELSYSFLNKDRKLKEEKLFEREIEKKDFNYVINAIADTIKSLHILDNEENLQIVSNKIYSGMFDWGCYESFYDKGQNSANDPLDILGILLRESLVIKSNKTDSPEIEETEIILHILLRSDYLYLKKTALYVLSRSSINYNKVFFEDICDESVNYVLFEGIYFGEELKHYFQNLNHLNDDEILLLDNLIERGTQRMLYKNEIDYKIWKQKLYQALSNINFFRAKYEVLKGQTTVDYRLGAALGPISSSFAEPESSEGESPLSKQGLTLMKNKEIQECINAFDKKGFDKKFTVWALINEYANLISEFPEKFTEDCTPFLETNVTTIFQILNSLDKAWNDKRKIDWVKVLDFLNKYLNKINWNEELTKEIRPLEITNRSILYSIVELLNNGSKHDNWSMNETEAEKALELINHLVSFADYLKDDYMQNEMEDYLTVSINTLLGKIIGTFIIILRRIAVIKHTPDQKIRWSEKQKKVYNEMLEKKCFDAFAQLGAYRNVFNYLDADWLIEKIHATELFHNQPNEIILWKAFIDGYFWNGPPTLRIYNAMKNNYEILIENTDISKHSMNKLTEDLSSGYLEGNEDLTKMSLFGKLLKKEDAEILDNIINYFWQVRMGIILNNYNTNIPEISKLRDKRNRVIEFIKWLCDYYKKNHKPSLNDKDQKNIANLSRLLNYLYEIDKVNFDCLKFIATYAGQNFNSTYFIEALDHLKDKGNKDKSTHFVSDLFLEMLNHYVPTYDKKNIISILNYLKDMNDEEINLKVRRIIEKYISERRKDIIEEFLKDYNEK